MSNEDSVNAAKAAKAAAMGANQSSAGLSPDQLSNQQRQGQQEGVLPVEGRLRKDDASAVRGSRGSADHDRTMTTGTAMTVDEMRTAFRNEWTAEALPNAPEIPGFHTCWLSTTNSFDPIHKRMRMGYVPVSADELPGFEPYRTTSGQFEGMISCNEMVLFKLPMELYQFIMRQFHHEMPLEAEQALQRQVREVENVPAVDAKGRELALLDEGMKTLVNPARAPVFQ